MKNRFLIVATGFNCADKVARCFEYILKQKRDWFAVFVDDGSEDDTSKEISKISHPNFASLHFHENLGAAKRRIDAIQEFGRPDDIIVLVGLDDHLLPWALERIEREYNEGKIVTYGSWVNEKGQGLPKDFQLDFPDYIHETRAYRSVQFRSTAPNSFRKWLFDLINEDDFKYNNDWIKATTESPLMFGCLEMAGKGRIGVIHEPVYCYDQSRKDNARSRFGPLYQTVIYNHVISIPKYDLLDQ